MAVQVSRDVFARTTLMRAPAQAGSCDWCGSAGRRFTYYWQADSGSCWGDRPGRARHAFCSVGCFRAYHD